MIFKKIIIIRKFKFKRIYFIPNKFKTVCNQNKCIYGIKIKDMSYIVRDVSNKTCDLCNMVRHKLNIYYVLSSYTYVYVDKEKN